jgi:predicted PurR-regulated permease PerM
MNQDRFRKAFLLVLVIGISVAFVLLLRPFLMTILMAAIFAGLVYPLYTRIVLLLRGWRSPAAALTLLIVVLVFVLPLLGILGVVVNQAIRVTGSIKPVVERFLAEPLYVDQQLQRLPGYEYLEPYRDDIVTRAGDIVNAVGGFLIGSLSNTTRGTVVFVVHFFILLYTMFFFLVDGASMLRRMLSYLPLSEDDNERMKARFLSMTRATVKGTVVIGIIQGTMSGLAFWVVGIPDVAFWTVVMVVLSILPMIGAALVWVPAAIILAATGNVLQAALLVLFCSLIVGSVDNVLRPRLVGRDTKMHDLLILFSTLGGIIVFGPVGFIVGPILAGLFVTCWEIFGTAYRDVIHPETGPMEPEPIVAASDADGAPEPRAADVPAPGSNDTATILRD